MINPDDVTPEVSEALARLRHAAAHSDEISNPLARAFQILDNAGVFAAIDEANDYASADRSGTVSSDTARHPGLDAFMALPAERPVRHGGIDKTAILSRRVDEI